MNLAQRFTLMVKGNLNGLFDRLEDPEQSLHQLVLDMEEHLEAAKRAAAAAMANEDRLRSKIAFHQKDAEEWKDGARRALKSGREEDARTALRRAEEAERQRRRLKEQLDAQERDTEEVRDAVARLHERLGHARARLQVTQAKLRQSEARQAAGKVLQGVQRADLYGEFDRLEARVEQTASEERAYLALDDSLRGDDVRRRFESAEVDEAVEDGLEALRRELES